MILSFTEAPPFEKVREDLFAGDEGFRLFQNRLLNDPRAGDVIPGTGGMRKVRWVDPARGKGKRSGIRVIYLYVEEQGRIILLFAYDKNIPDLTAEQKRLFSMIARRCRQEVAGKDY